VKGYLSPAVEVRKLARLIGADAEDLAYFERLEGQAIRDLRDQVTVAMFDADRQLLQRVATATKLIPAKLGAVIGERAFGALLCARITGLLDPSRAVDIAKHLPVTFLTDLSLHLDPRSASRVIGEMPPATVGAIAAQLAAREEYITMGAFVGHLSKAALLAALDEVDDESLLRTAYVIEAKQNIAALVALLPHERLEDIIVTASSADLWIEALDVLDHVTERQRGTLGDLAASQDDEVLDSMVRAALRDGLWSEVLPVVRAMSPVSRKRFATLKSIQARRVLKTIIDAAAEDSLWAELLVLLPLLPTTARRQVAALATSFQRETLEQIMSSAHDEELWPALIAFAAELDKGPRREIANLIDQSDAEVLQSLLAAVHDTGQEADLVAVLRELPAAGQRRLGTRIAAMPAERVDALIEAADAAAIEALSKALTK
jgi:hypothetical protein